MNATEFETAIDNALGEFACTNDNPCGGCGYYEPEKELPFRVLFHDGAGSESFATIEEAIKAAEDYSEQMATESV